MNDSTTATASERTQVRLSNKGHSILTQMKEDGYLAEMTDGYRLGIALALSMGAIPEEFPYDVDEKLWGLPETPIANLSFLWILQGMKAKRSECLSTADPVI